MSMSSSRIVTIRSSRASKYSSWLSLVAVGSSLARAADMPGGGAPNMRHSQRGTIVSTGGTSDALADQPSLRCKPRGVASPP